MRMKKEKEEKCRCRVMIGRAIKGKEKREPRRSRTLEGEGGEERTEGEEEGKGDENRNGWMRMGGGKRREGGKTEVKWESSKDGIRTGRL